MAYYEKSTGIILKKIKGKDSDQILVVFTQEHGKLYIIAKGAQKVSGRRVGILDSLNIIKFSYSENNEFYYLKEVDLISSLQLLKGDYQKRKAILVIIEILDKLLPNNQTEAKVFHFLKNFLIKLSKRDLTDRAIFIEIKILLSYLGYAYTTNEEPSWAQITYFLEQTSSRRLISCRL